LRDSCCFGTALPVGAAGATRVTLATPADWVVISASSAVPQELNPIIKLEKKKKKNMNLKNSVRITN
jgi:hypothetical protein